MFINKEVQCKNFEPDSCEEAWKHYKEFYSETYFIRKNYNFDDLFLYNLYKDVGLQKEHKNEIGKRYDYTNKLKSTRNRYYALKKGTKKEKKDRIEYCPPASRVGGECDFNFNDGKYKLFKNIIGDNQTALQQLNRCKEMHHTLLNFSLIQAMGNMQGFKGSNRFDRLDTFVYELNRYYSGTSVNVLSKSTTCNKPHLIEFLDNFKNIYKYCEEVYFINDKELVDEIIASGEKPIEACEDVKRYMDLAEKFWAAKESYFLKKEFLTMGGYFNNGGETYTLEELLFKLESDLGCNQDDAKILIEKCVDRGFITDCGNDIYER